MGLLGNRGSNIFHRLRPVVHGSYYNDHVNTRGYRVRRFATNSDIHNLRDTENLVQSDAGT